MNIPQILLKGNFIPTIDYKSNIQRLLQGTLNCNYSQRISNLGRYIYPIEHISMKLQRNLHNNLKMSGSAVITLLELLKKCQTVTFITNSSDKLPVTTYSLHQLPMMGVDKYTNTPPKIFANQYKKSATSVSVAITEAMGRLSHRVDWHSRDIANQNSQ